MVSTFCIIGGLLVLLIVVAAGCDDDPRPTPATEPTDAIIPTATHSPTSTPAPSPTSTLKIDPTSTPERAAKVAPTPTSTPAPTPTSTPDPTQTATPDPKRIATPDPLQAEPDPRCSAYDLTSPHREELYQQTLYANPSWYSSPQHVKDFLISRFSALEAHYLALRVLHPAIMDGIIFSDYLSEFNLPTSEGWRLLFADILDLAKSVQTPGTCGPEEAAYELLRYHGANILSQAVSANIHPALAVSARELIARKLAQCGLANVSLQCNQAELVFQEAPRWESILANR